MSGANQGFPVFKYPKTHVPENIDKFTEKLPSPSEKNFRRHFLKGDMLSEINKRNYNQSVGGDI